VQRGCQYISSTTEKTGQIFNKEARDFMYVPVRMWMREQLYHLRPEELALHLGWDIIPTKFRGFQGWDHELY
jgi:hypothetical protein